jgi:hypothetical protein
MTQIGPPAAGDQSRRQVLGTLTALGAVALAGCSEGGGGDGGGDGNADTDKSGDGCPSLPLSYTEKRIEQQPAIAFEVPADARYERTTSGDIPTFRVASDAVGGGDPWRMAIIPSTREVSSVDEVEPNTGRLEEEVTDEYDLSVDGARVFHSPGVATTRVVYLPTASDPIRVEIAPPTEPDNQACPEVARAVARRAVETVRPL